MEKLTREQVEVRRRWTEALRSGEYPQGKLFLNSDGRFCCLGVLCEVSGVHKQRHPDGAMMYEGLVSNLPSSVRKAAGLCSDLGDLGGSPSLTVLNDGYDFTFDEIADVIDLDTLMRQDGAL